MGPSRTIRSSLQSTLSLIYSCSESLWNTWPVYLFLQSDPVKHPCKQQQRSILLYRLNFNSPQNHDSWVFIPFECHVIYKILRTIRHLTGVCNFRESFGIQNKYSFTLNVTLWISKNSFCCGTCRFSKLFMTGTWNYIVVCIPVLDVYYS